MSKYQIMANDFLIKTGVTFEAKFLKNDFYFAGDKTTRDIYEINLIKSENRRMVFKFGQSLTNSTIRSEAPTAYDVLAGLTKYNVGTLEDFCSEYGYNVDSKSAEQIYLACKKEFEGVLNLWTDSEIEELREIN
jgi:hypothetical protein